MFHISFIVTVLVSAAAGFGVGRIKNAAKLAAIKAEVVKIEAEAVTEAKAIIARIKALV